LRPDVIAAISNETRYAAPNLKALPLVLPEVRNDPAVYPSDEVRAKLYKGVIHDPIDERKRTRLWSRVKTGL
jgi:putrescine transport system substrate-binding protein